MKPAKPDPIIIRTTFTQRLAFLTKPDHATRRKLSAAGWKWNGVLWWKTTGTTSTLTPTLLGDMLTIPGEAKAVTA